MDEKRTYHAYGSEVWRTDEARDGVPTILTCSVNPKLTNADNLASRIADAMENCEQRGHENEIKIIHHMYSPLVIAAEYARQLLESIDLRHADGLFHVAHKEGELEARTCAKHLQFAIHAVNTMTTSEEAEEEKELVERLLPHLSGLMKVIFEARHPADRQMWTQYVVASMHGLEMARDRAIDHELIHGEGAGRPLLTKLLDEEGTGS